MEQILMKAGCYVGIILLGYFLRQRGFFGPEAFGVLSKVVIKLTLPCAIISSSVGKTIDPGMLTIILLGFGGGVLCMFFGNLVHLRRGREERAFAILNTPGYNIGTFSLPFVQNFLGSAGMLTASLFDLGNTFICLGASYGIAASVKEGKGFDLKRIIKTLMTSVPFLAHVFSVSLNLLQLPLPAPILTFTQIVGSGNAFLAMLMLGVGFNLPAKSSQIGAMARILCTRYGISAILSACIYFLTPFPTEVRQTLVILAFSPIGSVMPIYTAELKGDVGLSSAINSVSILLSIVIIVTLLLVML